MVSNVMSNVLYLVNANISIHLSYAYVRELNLNIIFNGI